MGNGDEISKEERKYWLWVADSRSWLDEEGNDAKELDPAREMDPEKDWWTCNRDVMEGDLAFLWRTRRGTGLKSDIGYLMEIKSEAHIPEDFDTGAHGNWKYWCRYKSLYKFENPVMIDDFKEVPCLENWGVYRAHFQRRAYEIPQEQWDAINKIAAEKNPGYEEFLKGMLETELHAGKIDRGSSELEPGTAQPIQIIKEEGLKGHGIHRDTSGFLTVEDFRIPEEIRIYKKVKSHPAKKKIEIATPEGRANQFKKLLNDGVRLTRKSHESIFVKIEGALILFGNRYPKFDVFAVNELGGGNAAIFIEGELPVILFENNILNILDDDEETAFIGHEIGHLLLGHIERLGELIAIPEDPKEREEFRELLVDEECREFIFYNCLLLQLQELSADRIGLLVCQKLEAFISGLRKMAGGIIGGKLDIDEYIVQALRPDASDVLQTHPYGPHRSKALKIFSETDLYRNTIGEQGGNPISEFSQILPDIIPFPEDELRIGPIMPQKESPSSLEDYVDEIFLYTIVALVDGKETPAEIKTITEFVPVKLQADVMVRWDALNKEFESIPEDNVDNFLKEFYLKAMGKDKNWKSKVIRRMIKVARADRRIYEEELAKIKEIAEAIDAKKECSKQFIKEFGYDPFAQPKDKE